MKLATIQEALSQSRFNDEQKTQLVAAATKLNPETKQLADEICERNCTTLSGFLRECVNELIKDYRS